MNQWLQHSELFGNPAMAWTLAFGATLLAFVLVYASVAVLGVHLRGVGERTGRHGFAIAADVAKATRGWLLFLIAMVAALDFLHFQPPAGQWLRVATFALVGIQVVLWVNALLVGWLHHLTARTDERHANPVMFGVLKWAVQFVVWVTLVLAVLSQSNVNITAFVASLGVGGVAVALALQNVLGDLFASISIGLDKPFEVGEFIAFGTEMGTVTRVGIKSTRLRSISGEELAISNAELLKNLIHNYSRRQERRVVFNFRLPFDTPRDRIPQAVDRVRGFIDAEPRTRFDRGYLSGFGEYGLDFEFVYFVLDPDYNLFVEIQQRISLKMLDAWDELGIEFAVPARKVHPGPVQDGAIVQVTGAE